MYFSQARAHMAVILQLIDWQKQAPSVCKVPFSYWNPYYGQLTPVKARYSLTSINGPYRRLKCRPLETSHAFFKLTADQLLFFLTCYKQGRLVWNPFNNANSGIYRLAENFQFYTKLFHCFWFVYIEELEIIKRQSRRTNKTLNLPIKLQNSN